jgi:aryl-alcohol dehydrogenase-like predicted oxidoreductase
VDILYVHFWDWDTSIPEVMNGLHRLVDEGKVLYLGASPLVTPFEAGSYLTDIGASDCPAWVVAQANQYARDHGKSPFVIYQGLWNVIDRSFEREIIPMAKHEGASHVY